MFNDQILIRKGHLTGPLETIINDVIIEIKAPRGRRRFMLISRPIYGNVLDIENSDPIEHSTNFKQTYLKLGPTVVGSVLEVTSNWCNVTKLSVGYMPPQDELHEFTCPVEGQSGGLLIYEDGHGSFFAMPAESPNSTLLVKDEKDR